MEARWPGFAGTAGARDDCAEDPRVAIAVGKTLRLPWARVSCVAANQDSQRRIRVSGESAKSGYAFVPRWAKGSPYLRETRAIVAYYGS